MCVNMCVDNEVYKMLFFFSIFSSTKRAPEKKTFFAKIPIRMNFSLPEYNDNAFVCDYECILDICWSNHRLESISWIRAAETRLSSYAIWNALSFLLFSRKHENYNPSSGSVPWNKIKTLNHESFINETSNTSKYSGEEQRQKNSIDD